MDGARLLYYMHEGDSFVIEQVQAAVMSTPFRMTKTFSDATGAGMFDGDVE